MDAFWCITLSVIAIYIFIRSNRRRKPRVSHMMANPNRDNTVTRRYVEDDAPKKDDKLQKEYDDLKRQGYTDELIAVILPTINNGQ